ncbi:MAG: hypothetical protein PUC65_03535 [Clostridiales bacterium]|nr:hypothetical protein [Clostridiales bacterium]
MKKSNKVIAGIISFVLVTGIICSISFNTRNDKKSDLDEMNLSKTAISAYSDDAAQEGTLVPSTFLIENNDPTIKKLVADYYKAILNADKKAYDSITIDDDSIDVDVMLRKTEYIESYDNQKIYVTQGIDHIGIVAYVTYDLKIHTIDTPAPSIDQLLIHNVNGEPKLYFNELTPAETKQLERIRNHEEVRSLIHRVNQQFETAIKSDSHLTDFYHAISAKQS